MRNDDVPKINGKMMLFQLFLGGGKKGILQKKELNIDIYVYTKKEDHRYLHYPHES